MHHEFNAFLLLTLILVGSLSAIMPQRVAASTSPVKFGIRVWNYNTTSVVPNADVSLQNGSSIKVASVTNRTGWVNLTAPNNGTYTLHITLQTIPVYNATLLLNQTTTFVNLTSTNVTDYSFIFSDSLFRHVENVKVDLRVNSSLISSNISQANGTAVAKNIPFHRYNLTVSREGVFVRKSTTIVNATTHSLNNLIMIPTFIYSITVRDYKGGNVISSGTVGIYDLEVPTNNSTRPLGAQVTLANLWPGNYSVVVTSSNATIWRSLVTLTENTTQGINANIGYTITLHIYDALNRPIPSVSVKLIQNGVVVAVQTTSPSGIVIFGNLPESLFQLNFTLLQRSYATSSNITGSPVDLSIKLDDVIILGGALFNTSPLAASSALTLTLIAVLGTILFYRRRTSAPEPDAPKVKGSPK